MQDGAATEGVASFREDAYGRWVDDGGAGTTSGNGTGTDGTGGPGLEVPLASAGGTHAGRRRRPWRALAALAAGTDARSYRWAVNLPLLALIVAYAVRFSTTTVDSLRSFQQDAYDLSLYDQGIWLLSRFHAPFMTVMGTDMFAAHTVFIFVLLVPLYWVYPHTAALLVAQAVAAASGAIPVYLLGRRLLNSAILATMLGAAYLLNPAIQQGNLEQFHVEAFEAPLLAFAIYAAVVWRPKLLAAMVFLLLMCKQDDALYVVPLGLWVLWKRNREIGSVLVGAGVVVGLAENLLIVPALLNGVPATYSAWWPFGTLSATLRTLVRQPGQFWDFAVSSSRPWYVWQMVFSSGLAWMFAPGILAVAVPELMADTLSSNPYLHQIIRHYSMPVAAVLVCASVCGIARAASPVRRAAGTFAVTMCALWGCVLWGDAPFSDNPIVPPDPHAPSVVATQQLVDRLPARAVVSAAQNFIPNIDHRVKVYMFPNPFSQSYYGNDEYDGEELPFAGQVQYLLLPSCISCDGNLGMPDQDVFDRIASAFKVAARTEGVVLWVRNGAPLPKLVPWTGPSG
ncbi:MAG TPA: DUF2079 domain-containing protein [Acidimicrobiales bacterium]|nr:DUF2079 domain-containing protein [Acidimicrobiales bacterium]